MFKQATLVVTIVLLIVSLMLVPGKAVSERGLTIGGGLSGSLVHLSLEYSWRQFALNADLGASGEKPAASLGGRYFIPLDNQLVDPYLGAEMVLTRDKKDAPPPPPAPPEGVANSSSSGSGGYSSLYQGVSLSAGVELLVKNKFLPFKAWFGGYYVPGSTEVIKSGMTFGVGVNFNNLF